MRKKSRKILTPTGFEPASPRLSLRAAHQAILVGKNTVLADNPELTIRHWKGKNPVRIILGSENDFPKNYNIYNNDAKTIFIRGTIKDVLQELYSKNIISVLIEGGADVLQQFIDSNLWNEAHIISSDGEISQKALATSDSKLIKAPEINGKLINTFNLENDTIQILKNPNDLFTA